MPTQKDLIPLLIDGALSVFENADQLFFEAGVLANVKAFSRAYLLHQISLEECGKIEILGAAVTSCLAGVDIDVKSLSRAFRRHEAKNKINAYFLPRSEDEKAAEEKHDTAAAASAFKDIQEQFHHESNNLKNASLYVDFDGAFTSPGDIISQDDYDRIRALNEKFMRLTSIKVQMLSKWKDDIAAAANGIQELDTLINDNYPKEKSLAELLKALRERINTNSMRRKE
ncbi:TPA: AbiV family abortive infection protein [Pseudomonas aeruginosa]